VTNKNIAIDSGRLERILDALGAAWGHVDWLDDVGSMTREEQAPLANLEHGYKDLLAVWKGEQYDGWSELEEEDE
jgi:hypothetical protein